MKNVTAYNEIFVTPDLTKSEREAQLELREDRRLLQLAYQSKKFVIRRRKLVEVKWLPVITGLPPSFRLRRKVYLVWIRELKLVSLFSPKKWELFVWWKLGLTILYPTLTFLVVLKWHFGQKWSGFEMSCWSPLGDQGL